MKKLLPLNTTTDGAAKALLSRDFKNSGDNFLGKREWGGRTCVMICYEI